MFTVSIETYEKLEIAFYTLHHKQKKYNNGNHKLKNIRTFSYHGCLIEEGKIGSDYTINLEVKTDLRKSVYQMI
jgi:hypothetical protein